MYDFSVDGEDPPPPFPPRAQLLPSTPETVEKRSTPQYPANPLKMALRTTMLGNFNFGTVSTTLVAPPAPAAGRAAPHRAYFRKHEDISPQLHQRGSNLTPGNPPFAVLQKVLKKVRFRRPCELPPPATMARCLYSDIFHATARANRPTPPCSARCPRLGPVDSGVRAILASGERSAAPIVRARYVALLYCVFGSTTGAGHVLGAGVAGQFPLQGTESFREHVRPGEGRDVAPWVVFGTKI